MKMFYSESYMKQKYTDLLIYFMKRKHANIVFLKFYELLAKQAVLSFLFGPKKWGVNPYARLLLFSQFWLIDIFDVERVGKGHLEAC